MEKKLITIDYINENKARLKFYDELQSKCKHHSINILKDELYLLITYNNHYAFCNYLCKEEIINIYEFVIAKNLIQNTVK
jgi:hypothetical protein